MTREANERRSREEFEQFVRSVTGGLLRTGFLIVFDLPTAEDLVQDCLFKVARRWPRVRAMEHPEAYTRRILVNSAVSGAERHNRNRAELHRGDDAAPDFPDDAAERDLWLIDVRAELIAALRELPPRQRAVLALRYFDDLTEAQVADVLGCSIGTVKSTASKALDRIRRSLVAAGRADQSNSETTPLEGAMSHDTATGE